MLNGLDLFSGIGGISLALKEYVRPICYCEIDPYCRGVLISRMAEDSIPCGPIWDDVRTLGVGVLPSGIEIICGGFPCQDISVAGAGKGLEGERSGLFFEIVRLAKEIKPKFLFLENVPAITSRGGLRVVREVTEMGYDCRWCVISAASVGALHRRERWFLLANSPSERWEETGLPERQTKRYALHNDRSQHTQWNEEPEDKLELAGMVDGLRIRSHSIKALGNAVVPVQAKEAFEVLMGLK